MTRRRPEDNVVALPTPPQLRRVLGLAEVTSGGVGIIIGAGLYVLVGAAAAEAGATVWLAFLLAAVLSFLTGMSYMELASMFPSAAGEYEYTRRAFPELVAFLVGWIMVVGLVVAAAAISLGFARYLGYFFDLDVRLGAVCLLALVSFIAATGIKESARLTMALSVVQVGGLLFVIVIGVPHIGQQNLLQSTGITGVVGAAALVFFAFIGFDEVITLSEETENPTRTVPLALALALGLSTILYVAVSIAAVSVLGASALGASERPLADVIGHAIGGRGAEVMAGLAVITTTNTTLLAVTAASRLLYGMASQGSLPSSLAAVNKERQTPTSAILFASGVATLFVLFRDLKLVASVTDFAVYLVFLAVNGTVLVLRFKMPEHSRAFSIPGRIGLVPVVPILGIAAVLIMMAQLDFAAVGVGFVLLGLGLLVYFALPTTGTVLRGKGSTPARERGK
ncbi:MAG TPA: APC family permease [Nitrospira sp.]|nr:APC family permease [Nitrospira sp.]